MGGELMGNLRDLCPYMTIRFASSVSEAGQGCLVSQKASLIINIVSK
jgi:hypothetical protein